MAESREHQMRRHAVQTLEKTISKLRKAQYQHHDLDHLPVQILPMPLSTDGEPLFKSEFFCPYRKPLRDPEEELDFWSSCPEEVDDPMSEALTLCNYFGYYIHHVADEDKVGDHNLPKAPGYFRAPLSEIEYEGSYILDWRSGGICAAPDGPWMKCLLLESVNADDSQITRGEILCICRIMNTCLGVKSYCAYRVIPVLLVSFVGPRHARILLAHHDGTNLVIRQSKRFAFWEKDIHKLKILLQWWCSSGIGNTTSG